MTTPYPAPIPAPDFLRLRADRRSRQSRSRVTAVASAIPALGDIAIGLGLMTGLVALICATYLAKSALGIDLMPGPSPLHDLLYPLLGRG